MTAPDRPDADVQEQAAPLDDAAPATDPRVPPYADEADALEQGREAAPGPHAVETALPLEADEADTADQAVAVPLDEDERPAPG